MSKPRKGSLEPIEVENQEMTGTVHKAVLVQEVLTWLSPEPGKVYLDVTFGSGGHTRAILEQEPTCKVIAMDWDVVTLERFGMPLYEEFPDRLTLIWGNFSLLYKVLKKEGIHAVDGILADFGPSQVQLAERAGFSFYHDSPLDMRMSPSFFPLTAADVLNKSTEEKLRQIFWQLGEERASRQVARAIVERRAKKLFATTKELADLVEHVIPRDPHIKKHPATKIFQALRIYVNRELENIESLLSISLQVIRPGGRLVCISFHSLEDRLVKQFFQDKVREGLLEVLTKKAIAASPEEISENPSARSAKLRAVKIMGGT